MMFNQPPGGGMMGGGMMGGMAPNASSLMGMGGGSMMDPRMLAILQMIQNHAGQPGAQGMPGAGAPPGGMNGAPLAAPPGGPALGASPAGANPMLPPPISPGMQQHAMMNPLMAARLQALLGGGGGLTPQSTGGIPSPMGAPPAPGTFFGR